MSTLAVDPTLTFVMRIVGSSHLALALAHIVLWRLFDWSRETARLSPLTARVFAVHTFFVAFVLAMLGALWMQSLENGMVLLDVTSALRQVVIGLVLLAAVAIDARWRAAAP